MIRPTFIRCALTTLLLLWIAAIAQAQVLLNIDVSNPSAVTFTPTGNAPSTNATSISTNFPVRLLNFMTANPGTVDFAATSSTLRSNGSATVFNTALSGRASPGHTAVNLNRDYNSQHSFITGSAAFSGTATFNFSGSSSFLPSVGSTGAIMVNTSGGLVQIGTWAATSAVPEPSTYAAMLGAAALGFAGWRRRRRTG